MDFINEYIKKIPNIYFYFFVSLALIITSIILLIIGTYIIFKLLQISIDNSNIFFYTFNKQTTKILNIYGKYRIKKIYIIKQPIREIIMFICDLITFFNYSEILNNSKNYHTSLLFEISYKGNRKFLLLEKNNSINLTDKFIINNNSQFKQVLLDKNNKKLNLNTLLEKTKHRIGLNKFYGWNIAEDNCLDFTKNILETLGKYNKKYEEYIYKDNILLVYKPTEFISHTFNTLSSIMNIIEKYVYENILY